MGLYQCERECMDISYVRLEELTRNSLVRLKSAEDDNKIANLFALDKAQEIINWLTKVIPLGSDKDTWVYHSANVMFAHCCAE